MLLLLLLHARKKCSAGCSAVQCKLQALHF
jgi:hypothetical protein